MDDFLLKFATCKVPGDPTSCAFSIVREGEWHSLNWGRVPMYAMHADWWFSK